MYAFRSDVPPRHRRSPRIHPIAKRPDDIGDRLPDDIGKVRLLKRFVDVCSNAGHRMYQVDQQEIVSIDDVRERSNAGGSEGTSACSAPLTNPMSPNCLTIGSITDAPFMRCSRLNAAAAVFKLLTADPAGGLVT